MPSITIGIPIQTGAEMLRGTIASLLANTSSAFSVVLLPDGPDEITRELLSRVDLPQFPTERARGGAACLNRLVKNSDSEILVLLENGALVGPGWLELLLAAMNSGPKIGLAGPSTNRSWNEQCVFPQREGNSEEIARTAAFALARFGETSTTLAPLYSLADFCYVVRRDVFNAIGEADESYGLGPCWEMDFNIRAARAGFSGVWARGAYVYRAPATERRTRDEAQYFEASKRRYQDKFCGARLRGAKKDYRSHCRGDACANFAPRVPTGNDRALSAPLVNIISNGAPLASCIMPTCNRRNFIPRAIACFQRQDYPNVELIIVDNGNDPIRDLLPDDRRIRYQYVPHKLTIGALRNLACTDAHGVVILHWDDDDWYPDRRIRTQVQPFLTNRTEITGTSSLYYYDAAAHQAFLYRYGGAKVWVSGNTLAYKRSVWQRSPFPDLKVGEDSAFIWNASRASVLDLKDPELCVGTVHHSNTSPKNTKGAFWIRQPARNVLSLMNEPVLLAADQSGPLVSCVMPTFNRRAFISLTLASFHGQTYPKKELIVVDDGSDSVADLVADEPNVRYIRVPQRMSIGAKRNLGCREARGEIIAQWDDDDWYAPDRLAQQVAPILSGSADITGLANPSMLEVPAGRFWTPASTLHRRMFVGNVHGGTLVFRKNILTDNVRYPETNLAEDASLLQQAIRRRKRLVRLENSELFVYLRHNRNAWKFDVGRFINPREWSLTSAPQGFPPGALDLYRSAAASLT